ncbi:MAG: coproporphyrinogen III oxidase, partial [Gammaproteobacteria bacterium]|nr:coproporphyrinogen III oxidase [Gammaproteobacteria bacterium]
GIELGADDLVRREVITQLICHFQLDFSQIERQFNIKFRDYFALELKELLGMQNDGLLSVSAGAITVQAAGKLLIRNICMVFDRYLRNRQEQRFSKVI